VIHYAARASALWAHAGRPYGQSESESRGRITVIAETVKHKKREIGKAFPDHWQAGEVCKEGLGLIA
jgi:hypothetical protein